MSFLKLYNQILNTSVASYADLPYPVEKVQFKKNEVITDYGDVERCVYFLNRGMVEMTIKSYMTEKIIDFFFDHQIVTSLTSLLNQAASDVKIKALTDCHAEVILYEDLQKSYAISFDSNRFSRILVEQAYIIKAQREKDFLSKTAEERYAEMFESHSHHLSTIPVNKIAKYLGIHPESLSRIRKKLNS